MGLFSSVRELSQERSQGIVPAGGATRYQLIVLHTLVTIVLCYQLLFSKNPLIPAAILDCIAIGLIVTILCLIALPARFLSTKWLVMALVIADTGLTTTSIYLSGNASSNLYVAYFLVMLIAAFAPTLKQMMGLSVLLCSAYGVVLYLELGDLGTFGESQLLQVPILLILAIFFGVTNETARTLSRDKKKLIAHVSERKRIEEALRESEERYRRLVELSPDAIFITEQHRIIFMNRACTDLFGATSPEQVLSRSPSDFFHPEYDPLTTNRVRQGLERGEPFPLLEQKILRLDGTVIDVELSGSLLNDRSSTIMQVVLHNITERRQLEEQVRQSQKMEAVGQLAGGVAHDFNNMLLIINGHSELLIEDPLLTEDQRQSIEQIKQAAKRAASLTSQLLAFSRRQVLQPKVLDLNCIVANMEQMLHTLAGENIELVIQRHPSLGHVNADPGQLEQVIINLAVNARDATPQGGRLTIETDNVELDEALIRQRHLDAKPGSYVRLSVSDDGIGMDAKTLARIFEPFFTTKPKGKGTGLGLSTVYGTVKQSGGAIMVDSALRQGTSVKIYLPRVEESVSLEGSHADSGARLQGAETVLVAEDEPGVRSLVCDTLRMRGYSVLEARHGIEALMIAGQHSGPIHLLLTDVVMPQMNGREVAAQLVADKPDLKVLFMSGYTDDAILRHGVVTDRVDFLQKPFTPGALAGRVRRVLDARDAMTATTAH